MYDDERSTAAQTDRFMPVPMRNRCEAVICPERTANARSGNQPTRLQSLRYGPLTDRHAHRSVRCWTVGESAQVGRVVRVRQTVDRFDGGIVEVFTTISVVVNRPTTGTGPCRWITGERSIAPDSAWYDTGVPRYTLVANGRCGSGAIDAPC